MARFALGFGFYHHLLNEESFRFARQCGATHAVVHLVDYFGGARAADGIDQPVGARDGWGRAGASTERWTASALKGLRRQVNAAGLELEAIENFDPAHWYDVLLGGPRRDEQLDGLCDIIRNVGAAGIPVIGYNFSLAGVAGRISGPFARGEAVSVAMDGVDETPVPRGMVWNMVYDEAAPEGAQPSIDQDTLWQRLAYFLDAVIPVAERCGVRLAAHPDDPPVPRLRDTPRLVHQPALYERLLALHPSRSNALEFCLGSVAEMTDGDVYEATERHATRGDIAYIHFRNVQGKVPNYREAFVDDGDIDMARIAAILEAARFEGVVIPDHTPLMQCEAPWHAGMAYAMGYMRALQKTVTM